MFGAKFTGLIVFCLLIHLHNTSIVFQLNPGCDLSTCHSSDHRALFYGNQSFTNSSIHLLYSSFDLLTISIIETRRSVYPHINYSSLYSHTYARAIHFGSSSPLNMFSLVLRRLMLFNDQNDTAQINNIQNIYWFNQTQTNFTMTQSNITTPKFYLPLDDVRDIGGRLMIELNYPGETSRDSRFPKLTSTPKTYFLNFALEATNYTYSRTRFALEFYIIQLGREGTELNSSHFIDDQYTPGIFTVWQLKSLSPIYTSSMLWKPVVYQSSDRSIESTTLMQVGAIKNHIALQFLVDKGIFNALVNQSFVSGFNLTLGRKKDGFFSKSNYSFVQLTAGLDLLESDSTKKYITYACIVTLALPSLVTAIALAVIIRQQCCLARRDPYDDFDD